MLKMWEKIKFDKNYTFEDLSESKKYCINILKILIN